MHFESITFILQGMRRHIQAKIDEALRLFPCVAILGVRQCGKTTLINNLPKNWKQYDMEKTSDRELVLRDPDLFFRMNPQQVAIDEAQMVPELFPALRVAIDANRNSSGGLSSRVQVLLTYPVKFRKHWPAGLPHWN